MTDQLRALAEAEANKLYPPNHTVDDPFGETGEAETDPYGYDEYANNAYVRGFIAGRTSVTRGQIVRVLARHELGVPNGGTASWAWCKCSCGWEVRLAGTTRDYVYQLAEDHRAEQVHAMFRGGAK